MRKLLKRLVCWILEEELVTISDELDRIDADLRATQRYLTPLGAKVEKLQDTFASQLHVGVDFHLKSPHQVVLIGRHKKNDYVEIFDVPSEHFEELIDILKRMEHDYGKLSRMTLDAWPHGVAGMVRERMSYE